MYKAINKILCGVDYSKHIRNTISSKNEMISLASSRYLSAFSKAFNEDNGNSVRFYRGINVKLESPFMMGQYYREDEGDLSAFIRQNIFNVMPKWKNYPKRNKCIIAETEPTYPKAYGHLYLVLPENGTNIAIAPTITAATTGNTKLNIPHKFIAFTPILHNLHQLTVDLIGKSHLLNKLEPYI